MFRQVKYLGYRISEKGTKPSVEKTEVVCNFKTPTSLREIKQSLGITGFFRDFIEGYSEISTPLTALLRKNIIFEWTTECENAF